MTRGALTGGGGLRRRPGHGAVACAVVLLVAGCTGRDPVQLPPPPTPTVQPTPTAEPADLTFPQTCSDLVDPEVFAQIVAARYRGETTRVYAGPLESVGRTQRLTCSYGVTDAGGDDPGPPPAVVLTLNEYVDADTAAGRLDVTVEAAQSAGQQVTAAPVDGRPGYVLRDDQTVSAVLASGNRTAVATVRRGLVPAAAEPVVLDGLIAAMLRLPAPTPQQLPGATPQDEVTDPWASDQPQP